MRIIHTTNSTISTRIHKLVRYNYNNNKKVIKSQPLFTVILLARKKSIIDHPNYNGARPITSPTYIDGIQTFSDL